MANTTQTRAYDALCEQEREEADALVASVMVCPYDALPPGVQSHMRYLSNIRRAKAAVAVEMQQMGEKP